MLRLVLIAWLALCGSVHAQMNGGLQFPGPGTPHSAGAAFSGALDVIGTNVIACYSLQACSAALRGTRAVNACNTTGGVEVGCGDLSTDGTTGLLVPATISGITCPGANCSIKIWYDQTTGNQCGGASCDLVIPGGGSGVPVRPLLIASGYGSGPAATLGTTQALDTFSNSVTQSQPYSMASVSCRVANGGGGTDIFFGSTAANGSMYWDNTPNFALFAGGFGVVATSTNNTWQRYAGAFDNGGGAGSSGMVSGGSLVTGVTASTGSIGSAIGINNSSFPANYRTVENVIWSGNKSASFSNLHSNQATRFGAGTC